MGRTGFTGQHGLVGHPDELGIAGETRRPWERLMLGWRAARSPITVKMVVPTWGSLLETWGMDMGPSLRVERGPVLAPRLAGQRIIRHGTHEFFSSMEACHVVHPAAYSAALYGLQVFECSARHLSFTPGRRRAVRPARGAVSKQIAQLEARLGHLLFVRGTRCLGLTPAAERLLPFVREGLARMGGLSALVALPPTSRRSASRCPPAPAAGCRGGCRRSRGGGGGGAWQPQPWHRLLPGALRSAIVYQPRLGRYPNSQPLFREIG